MDEGVDALDLILIPGVAFDEDCNRVRLHLLSILEEALHLLILYPKIARSR
jgi:hypothetical protein